MMSYMITYDITFMITLHDNVPQLKPQKLELRKRKFQQISTNFLFLIIPVFFFSHV